MLPIPFEKKRARMSLKDRIDNKSKLENLLEQVAQSITVVIGLHDDLTKMTEDPLFQVIEDAMSKHELDVRSELNLAVLMFTTGMVCKLNTGKLFPLCVYSTRLCGTPCTA